MKKFISLLKHFKNSIIISIKASPVLFAIRILFELIQVFLPILITYITKLIVGLFENSDRYSNVVQLFIRLTIIMILVQIFSMLISKFNKYISNNHNERISQNIQLKLINKINSLDISYFDNPDFYNQIQNANRDSMSYINLSWILTTVFRSISQIISYSLLLSKLNLFMPIIIVCLNIPSALIDNYIAKKKYKWQLSRMTNERKINYIKGVLTERRFAKDVRVFGYFKYIRDKFEMLWKNWFSEKMKIEREKIFASCLASILPFAGTMLIFVYVGIKIVSGTATISDYTFYTSITNQFTSAISNFIGSINQGYESEMRLTNFMNFMNWNSKIKDEGNIELSEINNITFKNVFFKYPGTEKNVINNLSLDIKKDEKVALVGLNGAGKSTIVKLILRLYEPTTGTILINGINYKNYSISSLRKVFGVVFQDFNNYELLLKENVAIGQLDNINDSKKITKSISQANLNFKEVFNDDLNIPLGRAFSDNGIVLSGGQWQKLAISQAYFKDSKFMIMDEPNSALDPKAENKLFKNIKEICSNKGTIFITHRLSSVTLADKIIVLNNGQCVEVGTHDELLNNKGLYHELFCAQAEMYSKTNIYEEYKLNEVN